jgi:hypothetical protein
MPGVCQKPFAFSRLPPESQQAKSGDGRRKLTRCSSFVITMCSVLKRASCRYWCAAFRDDAGRQLRRSTKETDRRKALRIAEVFEQMARKKTKRRALQKAFNELYRDLYGDTLPSATVREYAAG